MISDLDLDLSGLTVLTEAAGGVYKYNASLPAIAGANVLAYTRDCRFASKEEAARQVMSFAEYAGVKDRIEIVEEKSPEIVKRADIVTNSGLLRPLDAGFISQMKDTAVLPLMWETWEYRGDEVDLGACRKSNIACLGTNESAPLVKMDMYMGMLSLKMLFDLKLEAYKNHILLIGSNRSAYRTYQSFNAWGISTTWYTNHEGDHAHYGDRATIHSINDLKTHWLEQGERYDAIVIAELSTDKILLGSDGVIDFDALKGKNPDIRIGVIAGVVDEEEMRQSKIFYHPEEMAPPRQMAFQLYDMGPQPIIELYAGGMKVGEAMARARLGGASVQDTVRYALANSPAEDFVGENAWIKN